MKLYEFTFNVICDSYSSDVKLSTMSVISFTSFAAKRVIRESRDFPILFDGSPKLFCIGIKYLGNESEIEQSEIDYSVKCFRTNSKIAVW